LRARLFIDADPGSGFAAWATMSLYNKAAKTGQDMFWEVDGKLVYTELEVATTGTDANIIPDDHTDFSPNDLVYFIDGGSSEFIRLATVANTMTAQDNPAAHPIDVGLVRVVETDKFILFNFENGSDIYCRVAFPSAQTVSLKLELLLRTW